jgi:hypothetical protein
MEWWIIAALTIVVLLLGVMYRIAAREDRALNNFALLILLDEKFHAVQRASLSDFVRATEAKSAWDLFVPVTLATARLAVKQSQNTQMGVMGLLWKLKNSATPL